MASRFSHILCNLAGFVAATLATTSAEGQVLSNVEVLTRCYGQITQMQLASTSPLITSVKNGKDPITACLEVFSKANFTANNNTRISSTTDTEAVSIVRTFQKIHASWFSSKDFSVIQNQLFSDGNADLYDVEEPAFFYTRALFTAGATARSVLTLGTSLKAVRSTQAPTVGAATGATAMPYIWTKMVHPAKGDLYGIVGTNAAPMDYDYKNPAGTAIKGTFNSYQHFGGGILGTRTYLTTGIAPPMQNFRPDGGEVMPRKLGRSIYSDFLCRDLPVIRTADAVPYVVSGSTIAFRQSSGCVRCHASMDRTASVARNFLPLVHGKAGTEPRIRGFEMMDYFAPTVIAEAAWPTSRDANYWRRPSNGVLYFRDYKGTLVDTPVNSLQTLGTAIANTDDFYMCVAKRYYSYFMGVDVIIADIADPADGIYLSKKDEYHRNKVIALGRKLKTSQSLKTLVEDILKAPDYKRRDFGQSMVAP